MFILLPLLLGCSQTQIVRNPASQNLKVFDAQAHFDSDNLSEQPSDALLKEFQEAGVVAAVVHLGRDKPKGEIRIKLSRKIQNSSGLLHRRYGRQNGHGQICGSVTVR